MAAPWYPGAVRGAWGPADDALGLGRRVAGGLIAFLSRTNVHLIDADKAYLVGALQRTLRISPRRIPDAIIAAAADRARCDWIATFDEGFSSPTVPSRLI